MSLLEDISTAVLNGKRKEVKKLVPQALEEGIDAKEILNEGLIKPMGVIGDQFSAGEVFVPEMLVAARAMSTGTEILKPYLVDEGAEPAGKADIGKNLVRMMIEGKGLEVADLGVDVAPEQFVEYVKANPDCHLVCMSALLTTTMPEMKNTVDAFVEAGLRDQVKIMIGGAPVTAAYAEEIGADSYTDDAGQAANAAAKLAAEFAA